MKTTAILMGAGKGTRMKSKNSKVYMDLCGQPVLNYALNAFKESNVDEIILVVAQKDVDYVRSEFVAGDTNDISGNVHVIAGGAERYDSVYQGLLAANAFDGEDRYVLIHDCARAFITPAQINECIRQVEELGACCMGMPVKDTIRVVDENHYGVKTLDRSTLWLVQTPQCFILSELLDAFEKMYESGDKDITDDVMIIERYGNRKVKMIEGGYDNIKITTPEDMPMGEAILNKRK